MDSAVIQLEKKDCESPQLLLQYSYYLNRTVTKQILIGFDPYHFRPYIVVIDFQHNTFLHFSQENWEFITECINSCLDYVNQVTQGCWASTHDKVWNINSVGDCIDGEERGIVIKNIAFDREIILNLEELTVLSQLAPYLTRMLKHYNERWGFVREYYRSYLLKCFVSDVDRLQMKQFYKYDTISVNYFRLFNEIPVLCKDKLRSDLQELYAGNV